MSDNILNETAAELQATWGLQRMEGLTEEELLKLLAMRMAEIITKGPDAFYQLMYRLDISEKKLHAISGSADAAEKIARLVYERQLEKIASRNRHKQNPDNTDTDLKW